MRFNQVKTFWSTKIWSRKWLLLGIGLVLFLTTVYTLWTLSRSRTFQLFGKLVARVETTQKVVALTFDDGPNPVGTDKILDILARNQVKATFCLTGAELTQYPDLGRKIVTAGHQVANHSFSHDRMVFKSQSFIRDEIERTDALIRQAGYQGEILFRPPYGKKLFGLPYYLSQTGRTTLTWDIEPESYSEIEGNVQNIVNHVTTGVRPGSIILLHVMYRGREASMDAVEPIITRLRAQGYTFVTVNELMK